MNIKLCAAFWGFFLVSSGLLWGGSLSADAQTPPSGKSPIITAPSQPVKNGKTVPADSIKSEAPMATPEPPSPKEYFIIDETVRTSFEPVSVTALVYDSGRLKQYEAEYYPVTGAGGTDKVFRVATVLPLSGTLAESAPHGIQVCFFLTSIDGDFAATTVESWSKEKLILNAKDRSELQRDFELAKKETPKQQSRNDALEQELERAKDRASNLSEVEDIIGLKSALEQLQKSDSSTANELELNRLKELVQNSKTNPLPLNAINNRLELSKQLQEIALATASSEQQRSSRKQNASANYFRKLELAREAEGVDIRSLAAQVLDLRQRRKELETRLGVTAAQLAGENQGAVSVPESSEESQGQF